MKTKHTISVILALFLFSMCTDDPVSDWEEVNLLEYGAAVKIKAPKNVKVSSSDFMGQKDITIKDSADYKVQIFISDANTGNIEDVVTEMKQDITDMETFESVVDSFKHGFIYKTSLDSSTTSHDFIYVEKKGDKQIQYQMGMGGIYSRQEVDKTLEGIRYREKD